MRLVRLSAGLCCVAAIAMLSTFHVAAGEPQVAASADAAAKRSTTIAGNRIMTLDPLTAEESSARGLLEPKGMLQPTPANFRRFAPVSKGQVGDTQTLTFRFTAGTKLVTVKSTPDFKVEQGGSCVEGFMFAANATCTLLVRSTPQGPGNRLGKLEITNSSDATPLYVGLGGNGYSPTISFTPSIISTVPGTYVSGAGIVSGATNLTVDGGDSLYIADTGNNKLESIDSSGTIVNATANSAFGSDAPISVIVDRSGYLYFTRRAQYYFLNIITSTSGETAYPTGSTNCAVGSTCGLGGANFYYQQLGALALDPSGNIFLTTSSSSAARFVQSNGAGSIEYIPLVTPYNYNYANTTAPLPLAVDSSDTLYTYYNGGTYGKCVITGESYYNAANSLYNQVAVAGTNTCGFSGDGGQARGAQISGLVSQMTFDIAGNLYFSDTLNQRVRRIDNLTGIITTVAGNGATGYTGDGGPATAATLNAPTGVAVDSQGQVYILSSSATTGAAQVVRKVGVVGALNLGNMAVGSSSVAQSVTLANTGNSQLDFTHVGFSSGNTSDFAIDLNTTSCNFTVPLAAGRSCKIGFFFTPTGLGGRSAVLSITDDTIAGINTIQLTGTGYTSATLTPASFSFASTNVGSSTAAQVATLTNTGKAVMTISSIVLSGTGAASYAKTTTCGSTLAVAASCAISVSFKPTAVGALPATLTVTDNAITTHQALALNGTGVAGAKAVLAPTSLSFASTKVGGTSAAQTIKLSNTGTAALGITSIKMAGTNATDFALTQACGTSIAAGGSCSFTVSFKPAATGTKAGTVTAVTSVGTVTAATTGAASAAAVIKPKVTLAATGNTMAMSNLLLLSTHVASNAATLTGSVHLMDGDRMIADATLIKGVVNFNVKGLSGGKHMLQAIYMGDTWNAKASSAILVQWVKASGLRLPVGGGPRGFQPVAD